MVFSAVIVTSRNLSPADYGIYIVLISIVELSLGLGSFGLDWVSARYVPSYRAHAPGSSARRFITKLVVIQAASAAVLAVSLWQAADFISKIFDVTGSESLIALYSLCYFGESISRYMRDHVLAQLLRQDWVQLATFVRNLIFVGCIGLISHHGKLVLVDIAAIELGATFAGLAVALFGYRRAMSTFTTKASADILWRPPSLPAIGKLAASSYANYLLSITYSPAAIALLITKMYGVELAGTYGFARNVIDQIKRLLPTELLMGIVRPVLVAEYLRSADFTRFSRLLNVLFQGSILILIPVSVGFTLNAGPLLGILSPTQGTDQAAGFALALIAALVPYSHRRIAELACYTVDAPALCVRANLAAASLAMAAGLTVVVSSISAIACALIPFISETLFNAVLVIGLLRRGRRLTSPLIGAAKVVMAGLFSAWLLGPIVGSLVRESGLIISTILLFLLTLSLSLMTKPVEIEDLRIMFRFGHARA